MSKVVKLSIEYFPDNTIGRPVSNGAIYVGIPDLNPKIEANQKQISVLQEDGTTIDVAQPLSTSAGGVALYNGSPVTILVEGTYSLRVDNSSGAQVYYVSTSSTVESSEALTSIQNLRDLSSSPDNNDYIVVLGYYSSGDGGGGPTRYFSTGEVAGTYVDNGGSIIVPTGGDGSEAWLWDQNLTQTNYRWWGISENNTGAENVAIIAKAVPVMTDVNSTGTVGTLYIDAGTFEFDDSTNMTCNLTGEGTMKTEAGASFTNNGILELTSRVELSNFSLDCSSYKEGIRFSAGSSDVIIDNVTSRNAGERHFAYFGSGGTYEASSKNVIIKNCHLYDAGLGGNEDKGDAMYFTGAQDWEVHSNYIDGFTRIGIVFEGGGILSTNPRIHHNTIKNGAYVYNGQEPSGIWTERCNGRIVHDNIVDNITCDVAYKARGISGGGYGASAPPDTVYPFITYANKISNCYVGMLNPGDIVFGNQITNFQTGIYFTDGLEPFEQSIIRDTYFGDTEFTYDGFDYLVTGGSKHPSCLFLFSSADSAEYIIDGVTVKDVTRATTGDYEYLSDLFVDSIAATAIEKITVKNVKTDIGFIARVEDDARLNKLVFENVPVYTHLGSSPRVQELLEFNSCGLIRGTPAVLTPTHSADEINIIGCTGLHNARFTTSSSAQSYFRLNIHDNKFTSVTATIGIFDDCFINVSDNTFDTLVGPFISTDSGTTRGQFNSNIVINQEGVAGTLASFKQAADVISANANTKDGVSALFTTVGGAALTESNTVTV